MMNRLSAALLTPVSQAIVVLLGTYTLLWGIWLAWPLTDVFGQADLYAQMGSLMPEYAWGFIAIVCGLGMLWGSLRPNYPALTWSAAIGFGHWFVISILYFMGDVVNTGGITSLFLALYAGYIYLNTKVLHSRR